MSQPYASSPAGSAAGTPGSTAATADGNPSTPAKLSLGQLHTQIPAIFQRARTGNMSAAQAHQVSGALAFRWCCPGTAIDSISATSTTRPPRLLLIPIPPLMAREPSVLSSMEHVLIYSFA